MTINFNSEANLPLPDDERCSSDVGVSISQTYTEPLELAFDAFDPDAEVERQSQVIENQIKDFTADPTRPSPGRGPEVYVGVDAEWEFDPVTNQNNILSVQFFVVGEKGHYARVFYPKGFHKDDRLSFAKTLALVITEVMAQGILYEWPSRITVCGFFLRVDLAAFSDLAQFKHQIDNVGGRAATIGDDAVLEVELDPDDLANITRNRSSVVGDNSVMRLMKIRFIDMARHAPEGATLKQLGDLLDLPKLALPEGYSIERMSELLKGDKPAFEAYGLRDAEIAVRYMLELKKFAFEETCVSSLPATASGLGVNMFRNALKESGVDYHEVFGLKTVSETVWSNGGERGKGGVKTFKRDEPADFRAIHEPFISDCYHGGRNECYLFGPTETGIWNDFDLAGAYTTGMVDLRHFEYSSVKSSKNPEDFRGHTLGFAWVRFSHPEAVCYPVLPVRHERLGLVFPMEGESYCTAPEIEVALNLGCKIEVLHGIIYEWKKGDDRIFEPFTTRIRELRKAHPKGSLPEQYAKLLGNSCYGKTAQGLREKRVFESRTMKTVKLPHSQITNAAMAAHTTGLIRAVLAEILNSILAHLQVVSVTTDGFLTTAGTHDLDLTGLMARRYQALCDRVAPGTSMLECKHQVSQLIPFKTRGQLTAQPYGDGAVVLAKAGVSPPGLPKAEHNAYMLDLFLNRQPGQKTQTRPFTSMREQWTTGADVLRKTQDVTLNMEFDMKRRPDNPSMRAANGVEHLVFETVPWPTASDGERARAYFDGWRRKNCLKTVDDYQRWQEHYQFTGARAKRQKDGVRGVGINATAEGSVGLARRVFLRAYAQGAWGVTRTMSYPQLAAWLTDQGYPTKADEVKNAKRAPLVGGVVPDTPQVRALLGILKAQFPALEVDQFLVALTGA
jgi:hypothetical protein